MQRRTYLTAAASTSLFLAGCSELTETDPADDDGGSDPDDPPADYPDAAGVVDDFEDLESWTVTNADLSADTDRAVVGSQSARLETPASQGVTRLSKTFAEPQDFTDVVPGLAMAADTLVSLGLRLLDADGNGVTYRRAFSGDLSLMRYNFGIDSMDDAFDDSAVREVHVQFWTADDDARTVWFDDLHMTPRPETGKVMIQFDDAHVTDYTEALPRLEEYGYPAVTFVNPGYIDDGDVGGDPRLTTDQTRELRDGGWCVANHTDTHPRLPELSREEQEAEIRDAKEWLVENGFEDGAEYFAYPFGQYDETTIELVDEYHELGFAGGMPVQGYTTNTDLVSRIGEPTPERIETELERTAELRGITKMFFHRLEGKDLEAFETMVETIHEYESQGDLEVILPQDLEERLLF